MVAIDGFKIVGVDAVTTAVWNHAGGVPSAQGFGDVVVRPGAIELPAAGARSVGGNGPTTGINLLATGDFGQHEGVGGAVDNVRHPAAIVHPSAPSAKEAAVALRGGWCASRDEGASHSLDGGIIRCGKGQGGHAKIGAIVGHPIRGRGTKHGFNLGGCPNRDTQGGWQIGRIGNGFVDVNDI